MSMPIVVVASRGIPVTESTNGKGIAVVQALNGLGVPVVIVASGGVPVVGSGTSA